jgi:hypothetical protein
MAAEAKVDLLYHAFFCESVVESGRITGVVLQSKSGRQTVRAQRVIDCTGDGDVGASAGCPWEKGRSQDGRCQPVTLMFTIGGVDWAKVAPWRTSYPMKDVWEKAQRDGLMEPFQTTIMGWWWTPSRPDWVGVNFTHVIHVDSTNVEDLTRATIEARRQAFHSIEVYRKIVPGMEHCYMVSTPNTIGIRESRRILGDYVLNEDDVKRQAEFPDAIGYGSFFVDIHAIDGPGMDHTVWRPPKGFKYQIPYRILVPRGVENLLTAGRCVSCTHIALGSLRVMVPCIAMGEAAGTAAALSLRDGVPPARSPCPSSRPNSAPSARFLTRPTSAGRTQREPPNGSSSIRGMGFQPVPLGCDCCSKRGRARCPSHVQAGRMPMTRRHTAALALLALLAATAAASDLPRYKHGQVHVYPAAAIAAQGTISADGDLADWKPEAFITMAADPDLMATFSCRLAFAYDDDALYLAARYADTSPMVNIIDPGVDPFRGWAGDALQVRLVADAALAHPIPEAQLKSDTIAHLTLWFYTAKQLPVLDIRRGMDFHGVQTLTGPQAGVQYRAAEGGYALEARLPWALLGAAGAPQPGQRWVFTVQPQWGDAAGKQQHSFFDVMTSAGFHFQRPDGWGYARIRETRPTRPSALLAQAAEEARLFGDGRGPGEGAIPVPYTNPAKGFVSLALCRTNGPIVRTLLAKAPREAGPQTETWDGLDDTGKPAASRPRIA